MILVPFSTDIKERYWTYNKAAICTTDLPGKHIVIDGKTFSKVASASSSDGTPTDTSFSPFWLVERTTDKKAANMCIHQIPLQCSLSATLPDKKTVDMDTMDCNIPVLVNEKKIDEHTKLMALEDAELLKASQAAAQARDAQTAKVR